MASRPPLVRCWGWRRTSCTTPASSSGQHWSPARAATPLFFLIGLLFSLPMLRRLYRRFGTWKAPAIAVGIFAALFSLSAFVIGPALSGDSAPADSPTPPSQTPTGDHTQHHSP